jgi:hypothetical protein
MVILSLLACVPASAATFEMEHDDLSDSLNVRVRSDAPGVMITILDESGQEVESTIVRLSADGIARYPVKYKGPFDVQVRDLTKEELHKLQWERHDESMGRKTDEQPDGPSIRELVGSLFGALFIAALTIAIMIALGRMAKTTETITKPFRETITKAFRGTGLYPIGEPEIRLVASQAHALLQPPFWGIEEQKKIGPVFSFRIGRHDAFLYEWVYYSPTTEGWTTIEQHAYIVFGLATPYLRLASKRVFGKPANTIDFPDDRAFSKAFWIEGTDEVAVRRFLGPELRQFLLSLLKEWSRDLRWREWRERLSGPSGDTSWSMSAWRFHAGPEGVALVLGSRTDSTEAHHVKAMFERLVTVTEAAARQAR